MGIRENQERSTGIRETAWPKDTAGQETLLGNTSGGCGGCQKGETGIRRCNGCATGMKCVVFLYRIAYAHI